MCLLYLRIGSTDFVEIVVKLEESVCKIVSKNMLRFRINGKKPKWTALIKKSRFFNQIQFTLNTYFYGTTEASLGPTYINI